MEYYFGYSLWLKVKKLSWVYLIIPKIKRKIFDRTDIYLMLVLYRVPDTTLIFKWENNIGEVFYEKAGSKINTASSVDSICCF